MDFGFGCGGCETSDLLNLHHLHDFHNIYDIPPKLKIGRSKNLHAFFRR